jgi:hypothetical protein
VGPTRAAAAARNRLRARCGGELGHRASRPKGEGRGGGGVGWAASTPAHDAKGKGRGGSRLRGGGLAGPCQEADPGEKGVSFYFLFSI